MTETDAITIARCLNGLPWQPIPGLWLIVIQRDEKRVVVLDENGVSEYPDLNAFEDGDWNNAIEF